MMLRSGEFNGVELLWYMLRLLQGTLWAYRANVVMMLRRLRSGK